MVHRLVEEEARHGAARWRSRAGRPDVVTLRY